MGYWTDSHKDSSPAFPTAMKSFTICCLVLSLAVVASSMDVDERKGKKGKPKPSKKPSKKPSGTGSTAIDWPQVWEMLDQFQTALKSIEASMSEGGSGESGMSGESGKSGEGSGEASGKSGESGSGSGSPAPKPKPKPGKGKKGKGKKGR